METFIDILDSFHHNIYMYPRTSYLNLIDPFIGKPVIKVITGIRRSGKSTILKLLQEKSLSESGTGGSTLFINKESLQFDYIRNERDLYNEVLEFYQKNGKITLFIDEVQEIESWEKAVTSFLSDDMADIYITGSNARLLSSELATLIAGRYVAFETFPLTYDEFLIFKHEKNSKDTFNQFIKYGGLPGIHHFPLNDVAVYQYIEAVFDSIVLKDVVSRNRVRNTALLQKIIFYVLDNIGSIFSANSIHQYFKKEKRSGSIETIYSYLSFLESAYIIHRVPRYDIKGKKLLEVQEKYFVGDIGLRNGVLGFKDQDISGLLENIVYLELRKRGFQLYIGKIDDKEIDFIAIKEKEKIYIQVCYLLATAKTVEREFGVLEKIQDNYPKYVLSMDDYFPEDRNGIKWLNLVDFILGN